MARVTASAVKKLIDTDTLDADVTDVFIPMAELITNDVLADKDLSEARLTEIERWLAAHYIAASIDPQTQASSISGAVGDTFEGVTGTGLAFTRYGTQAIALDTSGTLLLISQGKGIKAASGKAW